MGTSARLRRILEAPGAARAAGAQDALTARLVEEAGFDVVWASSFVTSASRGLPDMSLLTMTDYLQAAQWMARATPLPVLADCDTGFGNRLNVALTVRSHEEAGVAGICIEDKVFPKRNSFMSSGQRLEDREEFAARVGVAKEAQRSPDFVVVARTEALIAGSGMDDAIGRARAYEAAGADAILIHSKYERPDEIEEFLRRWKGSVPVVAVPTTYYTWNIEEASRAGVSLVIYANQTMRASVQAVRDVLLRIRAEGDSASSEPDMAPVKEIFRLTEADTWNAIDA
ncbi:isocitrate lyase/phosphoenolpyruvate mutase family protein [Streptomyces tagetis]|uniref:Isocitrate lyase/phosphoenolpyruvate mutase family protein n=1 Tax=Streptomyces tagetis TaxID=2820809 RepID=A0A940XIJ7_9ACTN|nr:isocitrate lyase/phosphoenolpyruvate mutase family protein [Streptomyces sp. RG38]MBQ0825164.1 isocitrate lyase/phosphoenolpyruvate mutase family protein [Streptomyces sp. RG38]